MQLPTIKILLINISKHFIRSIEKCSQKIKKLIDLLKLILWLCAHKCFIFNVFIFTNKTWCLVYHISIIAQNNSDSNAETTKIPVILQSLITKHNIWQLLQNAIKLCYQKSSYKHSTLLFSFLQNEDIPDINHIWSMCPEKNRSLK